MRIRLKKGLRAVATALATILCMVAPAQAVFYTGEWDPQFGSPFTTSAGFGYNLGWSGDALIFVPDPCVPAAPGLQTVSNNQGGCGFAVVQGATVELYDMTNPNSALTTLTFPASTVSALAIASLRFQDGILVGLNTTDSAFVSDTGFALTGASFALSFVLDFGLTSPLYSGPFLKWLKPLADPSSGNANVFRYEPEFTLRRVPEPSGFALVIGALIAAVAAASIVRRGRSFGQLSRASGTS